MRKIWGVIFFTNPNNAWESGKSLQKNYHRFCIVGFTSDGYYIINDPCSIWGWNSLTHTIHETGIYLPTWTENIPVPWMVWVTFHIFSPPFGFCWTHYFGEGTPQLDFFRNFSSPPFVRTSQPQRVVNAMEICDSTDCNSRFSYNGGTQQPWVFLLKIIILGCFWG